MNETDVIVHGNNTHYKTNKSCDEIIDKNTKYSKCLSVKIPTGARFIITSKICSTKQISKSVSNVLKLAYSQIEKFPKNAKFLSGYNKFCVPQNSDPIIHWLTYI